MDFKQALEQYIAATNTHNFNEVARLLHPNATYWFSDKTCTTKEQIQSYFEHSWSVIKEEVYSANDVQWLATSDEVATCIYTYQYEGLLDGKFVSGQGRATNVFKKECGEWKLIHEHLSQ